MSTPHHHAPAQLAPFASAQFARGGEHPSAFASREVAYSLLVVGITDIPGVEDHATAILQAMRPWRGGHRLPNYTFTPAEYTDAYDEVTIARLRRAMRAYDPDGVTAIGRVITLPSAVVTPPPPRGLDTRWVCGSAPPRTPSDTKVRRASQSPHEPT